MIKHFGNRSVFAIATALSLIAHIALAAMFIESDDAAQIAGGQVMSIAVMGDGAFDQLLAGEINPNLQKKFQEPHTSSPELQPVETRKMINEKPFEALKDLPKDPNILISQMALTQTQSANNKSEPVEIKTASILSYSAQHSSALTLENKQQVREKIDSNVPDVLASTRNKEEIARSAKPSDAIEAHSMSDLIPIPQFRPSEDYKRKVETASLAPQQPVKKTNKTTRKPISGNDGKNQRNTKKGSLNGKAEKGGAGANKQGNSKSAGSGNITNYKGKVRRKIARRFNPRSKPAKRDAVVSFTIAKNGRAQSIRLARSSGNAKLDRAALSAVKSASPFPSLPSGNSNLAFHVQLNAR